MTVPTSLEPNGPVLQSIKLRLSYADCDPAGIVYYAAYYPWFERVYNEWTVVNDIRPDRMRDLWGATHITRASDCEYLIPGRLFDQFTCEMRLGHLGNTSFSMRFEMINCADGKTYAIGRMVFVFVDDDFPPRPVAVPDGFKEELRAMGCKI